MSHPTVLPTSEHPAPGTQHSFTYLRVHTHFSSRGGPGSPAGWRGRAADLGYTALAITDRAPLAALPEFREAAAQAGITPIYGVELDLHLPAAGRKAEAVAQPALLLARGPEGVANLFALCSVAFAAWPAQEKPVPWQWLEKYADGLLLVLLGGEEGAGPLPLAAAPPKQQAVWGAAVKALFAEAAFISLPHSGRPEDDRLADQIMGTATRAGLPAVALPAARYLHAEEVQAYRALRRARQRAGWAVAALDESGPASGGCYLRAPQEASTLFARWPLALDNLVRAVAMCLPAQEWRPDAPAPVTNSEAGAPLAVIARERLRSLLDSEVLSRRMEERLRDELAAIELGSGQGPWLGLARLADEAKQQRTPAGAPIGAADGSLLAYALGISPLEPTKHARPAWLAGAPTVTPVPGLELPSSRTAQLLNGLEQEYGVERVAHAACRLEITPAQAVRASGELLGLEGEALKAWVLAAIQRGWEAFEESAVAGSGGPDPACVARKLRGAPLLLAPDPEALVVAPPALYGQQTLAGRLPLLGAGGGGASSWTPWCQEELCRLRYPLLTVRSSPSLSVADQALVLATRYPVPGLRVGELDLSCLSQRSAEVDALLTSGELAGIPYLASQATQGWEGGFGLEEMALLVTCSISSISEQQAPDLPVWVEQTARTVGLLLYHDQLSSILSAAAGVAAHELPALSRAMLRSDKAGAAYRRFVDGCARADMAEDAAAALWDALAAALPGLVSRYAAAAWGRAALLAATIKAYHPAALLAAAFAYEWERGMQKAIPALWREAQRLAVKVLPPDVARSAATPLPERDGTGWAIRWGLVLLPEWNLKVAEQFAAARPAQDPFSVDALATTALAAQLTPAQLAALVQSGACDRLDGKAVDRQALIEALPALLEWAKQRQTGTVPADLFSLPTAQQPPLPAGLFSEAGELSPRTRYARRQWERAHLGVEWTEAPEIDALSAALDKSGELRSRLLTTAQIGPDNAGQSIYLVGLLCGIRLVGEEEPMAVATLEDLAGSIELVAFPAPYKRHIELWTEHNLLIVTARVSLHSDGEVYLLCEHLAPFHTEGEEGELNLKVRASRRPKSAPVEGETEVLVPDASTVAANGGSAAAPQRQAVSGGAAAVETVVVAAPPDASTYKLVITLPVSLDDHADIDAMIALNAILQAHPGPDTVTLRIPYSPETGAVTTAQLPRGVRFSRQLEHAIHDLLGADALAVIKLL